jgi:hypothetical protein
VNAGAALDARTQAVFASIWLEGLGDLPVDVLRAAFRKTLRQCAYWPVKLADIRKHVANAESNATDEAAEKAWARVLEIRRIHWNPDIPGPFDRAVAKLSERVRQAARAAGVFREFTASEFEKGALHTWGKKRFIESFTAYGELERDGFLLPDGEVKRLLTDFATAKALPAPAPCFEDLHKRGLQYAEGCKELAALESACDNLPEFDAEAREKIETELAAYRQRFDAALAKRQHGNTADNAPELQPAEVSA